MTHMTQGIWQRYTWMSMAMAFVLLFFVVPPLSHADTLQQLNYMYDAVGNVTSISDGVTPANNQTLTYDELDRLDNATGSYGFYDYEYDPIGNLTTNPQLGTMAYPNSGSSSIRPHAVSTVTSGGSGGSSGTLTFTPEADTYLFENEPTTNFGTADYLQVAGTPDNGWRREGYLRFNITGLPTGATVTSATLTVVNGGYSLSASVMGGSLHQFAPSDPTWSETLPTWTARAGLAGNDASGPLATLGAVSQGSSYTFANLQSAVTGNGRVTFVLRSLDSDGAGYFTKETATTNQRPVLTVQYTVPGSGGTTSTYLYDANGNLTSGGGRVYDWNEENKPTCIATATGACSAASNKTTIVYDGNGGRLKKTTGSTTVTYISKLYECETLGGPPSCSRYIWAGNKRIAVVPENSDALVCNPTQGTGKACYYHKDHLGSSSVITDPNGTLVETLTYYPYGEVKTDSPGTPVSVAYKYTGKEKDSTGLYYYEARYYDATLARFISADTIVGNPFDPQDLNRYTYAGNNPFKYTDPTGHIKIGKFFKHLFGKVGVTIVGTILSAIPATSPLGMIMLNQTQTGRTIGVAYIVAYSAVATVACVGTCGPVTMGLAAGALGGSLSGIYEHSRTGGNILETVGRSAAISGAAGAVGGFIGGDVLGHALKGVPMGEFVSGVGGGTVGGAFGGGARAVATRDRNLGQAIGVGAAMGAAAGAIGSYADTMIGGYGEVASGSMPSTTSFHHHMGDVFMKGLEQTVEALAHTTAEAVHLDKEITHERKEREREEREREEREREGKHGACEICGSH